MTRQEAMFKVIALEPISKFELRQVCGWPLDEFEALLSGLVSAGDVTYINCGGHRFYRVAQ